MCNPRRVHVNASQLLAEAWDHEIERIVSRSSEVTAEARSREPLDATIGAPTLVMLARVLEHSDGWQVDGDTYTHPLDGGQLIYHADTQELEIVATVRDTVTVEGRASHQVHGDLDQTVDVTGTGVYYDDNWGGITADDAAQAAARDAQRRLDQARLDALDQARTAAEDEHAHAVEAAAATRADEQMARDAARRSQQLRAEARRRLTAVGIQGRNIFHQVLATAYRDAILAYARARGAEGLTCTQHDGIVEIQFEMPA